MSHTQAIAMQAKAFLEAYETLDDSMYQKIQLGSVHFRTLIFERAPVVTAAIVCIAFAAEMAMKALIVDSAGGRLSGLPKSHDLDELFKNICGDVRVAIASALNKSLLEVEDSLRKNAKAFAQWRYSYEEGAWADEEFLRAFVRVALAQIAGP
jgi:HEPN domain-containing protein